MRLRYLLAILAMVLLSNGCSNRVLSEQPWFDIAIDTKEPAFRDGIWLADDSGCKVREAEAAETWPDCASWAYRRGNQSLIPQWLESCEGRSCDRTYDEWSTAEVQVVAGDPMISQKRGCDSGKHEDAAPEDAPAARAMVEASENVEPKAQYCYDAVRPLSRDSQGRITSVETWPVLCGPWPGEDERPNVTSHPWPGVTIVDENCTVASEAALRDVAMRSYEPAKAVGLVAQVHWVRDWYR